MHSPKLKFQRRYLNGEITIVLLKIPIYSIRNFIEILLLLTTILNVKMLINDDIVVYFGTVGMSLVGWGLLRG